MSDTHDIHCDFSAHHQMSYDIKPGCRDLMRTTRWNTYAIHWASLFPDGMHKFGMIAQGSCVGSAMPSPYDWSKCNCIHKRRGKGFR